MAQAMRHPNITDYPEGYPVAVNEAQAVLMEGNGWVRVDNEPLDYSRMTKGTLLDEVERLGLELPDRPTVANLRELLEADQSERLSVLAETEAGGQPLGSNTEES